MAQEIFTDIHLDFVYSPLNVSYGIVVDGNVANVQTFDASANTYTPNYASTYCVLRPWMRIMDPDGTLPSGEVQMANMHWYVYDGTAETEISGGSDYVADAQGRLSVRRNLDAGQTLLFRFTGEYTDPRTGQVWRMEATESVGCEAESEPARLWLSQEGLVEWDPTSDDPQKVVLRADLFVGRDPVAASDRELVWEKKDGGDTDYCRIYRETDPDYDHADYDVELSADGRSLTLMRELMGMRVDIRCRAKYDPYGSPASVTLGDSSPSGEVAFTRNIPTPTVEVITPKRFPAGQTTWTPRVNVYIGDRLISNPGKFWSFRWYLSTGVSSGAVTKTLVGEGLSPTLPLSYLAKAYGATLVLGCTEKPPLAAVVSGGFLLTSGGEIILA